MRRRFTPIRLFAALALASAPLMALLIAQASDEDYPYLIGRGKADVTGPAVGVQLWGFVREDQIAEGIHFRLFSRAFVIAERDGGKRIAFASVDLGSITHAMHQEVVDRLRAKYGDAYTEANVILSATHTHSGPSGFWHYGTTGPIGSPFYPEYFRQSCRASPIQSRRRTRTCSPARFTSRRAR
jgi:neutral ceramidase